jgi:hypothetical protein
LRKTGENEGGGIAIDYATGAQWAKTPFQLEFIQILMKYIIPIFLLLFFLDT